MDSENQAILNWINTFELDQECKSISELPNGLVLLKLCNEISPYHFEIDSLNQEVSGNWIIASSNLKKLMRLLDEFYTTVLFKKVTLSDINAESIARHNDMDQLASLVEVVMGAAVMCEQKAHFIARIFALDHDSQTVLKGMIERVMTRVTNIIDDDGDDDGQGEGRMNNDEYDVNQHHIGGVTDGDMSEDLLRSQELVRHLQDERQRLLKEVSALDQSQTKLKNELDTTKTSYQSLQAQMNELTQRGHEQQDSSTNRLQSSAALHTSLQSEVEELKRELDIQMVDAGNLRAQLKAAQQRYDASREIQAKLEMESHQMADELDVSRDKAQRLAKAEATIDKYQKKLEEMVALKKQNKELSDKMDSYLDKIQELESNNKNMTTLTRLVDQYRDKAVELEREKFEAISTVELNIHELNRLRSELDTSHDAKRFLEDEVETLRAEVQSLTETAALDNYPYSTSSDGVTAGGSRGVSGSGGNDAFEIESVTSLREKVHRLERELTVFKSNANFISSSSSATDQSSMSGTTSQSESQQQHNQEIALLVAELDDIKKVKKERDDALIASKKQVSELTAEVHKMQRIVSDLEQNQASNQAAVLAMKSLEQKSSISTSTMKLLEEKLKEREGAINRLEQEKGKLETYARRTLSSFKDKYMNTLQIMKNEKRALEERVTYLTTRHEHNQETSRREERLLMSAVYEIGVRLMDRKIQEQVLEPNNNNNNNSNNMTSNGGNTFLGTQRQYQSSMIMSNGGGSSGNMAGDGQQYSSGSGTSSMKTPSKY